MPNKGDRVYVEVEVDRSQAVGKDAESYTMVQYRYTRKVDNLPNHDFYFFHPHHNRPRAEQVPGRSISLPKAASLSPYPRVDA